MKDSLASQLASLKAQISVLAAQIERRDSDATFGSLYGLLREYESSEEEIDKVRYRLSEDRLG